MVLNQQLLQMVLPFHPCLPYLGLPLKEKDRHHHQILVEALDQILQPVVLLRVVHLLAVLLRVVMVHLLVAILLLKVCILNMRSY
jgi:hypothetical protein